MSSVVPQTPYNEYTGNGVATVYPYEFQLLSAGDLIVTIDGVVIPSSDFTLSGVGVQAGGDVTFDTAPLNGTYVLLNRDIALERDTDYQYNGELKEATLDSDLNRLWQAMQGWFARLTSSVRAPYPEQLTELPSATVRANKTLGFDSSGNPTVLTPAAGTAASVLTLLADTASPANGDALVGVKYNTPTAVALNLHDWIEDDGGWNLMGFVPQASKAAIRARTSTTDMGSALRTCIDAIVTARSEGKVKLPMGRLFVESSVPMRSGVSISGQSGQASLIEAVSCDLFTFGFLSGFGNTTLEKFAIHGNSCGTNIALYQAGTLNDADELNGLTLRDLLITNFNGAMKFRNVRFCTIENNWMQDVVCGIQMVGKCLNFFINRNKIVKAAGPGAGTAYGILCQPFNFTSGTGLVSPEGVRVNSNLNFGFEYGEYYGGGLEIRSTNPDIMATRVGILASGLVSASWEGGYVQVQSATATFGIHLPAQSVSNNTKLTVSRVNVNASGAIPANVSGVMIGTRASGGNQDGVTVENCEFTGFTGYDIEQYASGNNRIEGNRCLSSGTTQSMSITSCTANRPTYVEKNDCAKLITYDAADFNSGVLQLGTNVISGTTTNFGRGAGTTPTFAAGDFTANGAMTWTVIAGNVATYTYSFSGKYMTVQLYINATTVAGAVSTQLLVKVPAGRTIAKNVFANITVLDNGVRTTGTLGAIAGATVITIQRLDAANWTASAGATFVFGSITFEVQ